MPQTIYNVAGASVRMNAGSDDGSTSIIDIEARALFESMRQEIMTSGEFGSDHGETLYDRIYQMESAVGTPAYAQKFASFVALAANHMDTFRPFLPALAQLLLGEPVAPAPPTPPDDATVTEPEGLPTTSGADDA